MDEGLLNDLLECSVCLERLDTSSRVLPCQHTFCLKCLKVIVESHKELRCPECRVLVEAKVEELPPNVLLMRILEGMRNNAPRKMHSMRPRGHIQGHLQHGGHAAREGKPLPPHGRALFDFISKEPGDLSFKKGDTILIQKKLDAFWYQGETSGRTGVFPISYLQVVVPLPVATALCKALYDFRMSAPDEEGCLAFDKGAIITVHRRVDENWAEGRLEQRVGIFPIAFVELNQPARQLVNSTPLNRPVPPPPEQPRPAHLDHRYHAQNLLRYHPMSASVPAAAAPAPAMSRSQPPRALDPPKHALDLIQLSRAQPAVQTSAPRLDPQRPAASSDSSSSATASAVSSNTCSDTSASEPSVPSSPDSAPSAPDGHPDVSLDASLDASLAVLSVNESSTATNTALNVSLPAEGPKAREAEAARTGRAGGASLLTFGLGLQAALSPAHGKDHAVRNRDPHREKRHSLTPASHVPGNHATQNRHSAEIVATSLLDQAERGERRRRSRSGERTLPAAYVALYPYRPQKLDELELRKGGQCRANCRIQPSDQTLGGERRRRSRSGERTLPAAYVALYPYRPQKLDELELRKGGQCRANCRIQPSDQTLGGERRRRSRSGERALPAAYVALYPYRPQKLDELELRKGGQCRANCRIQPSDQTLGGERRRRSRSGERALPAAYVALYPYRPQKLDELELRKGGQCRANCRIQPSDQTLGGERRRRSRSGERALPAAYVALYPYRPQKLDELELRKGGQCRANCRIQPSDQTLGGERRRRSRSGERALPAAYVALYPYRPQKLDELELRKGGQCRANCRIQPSDQTLGGERRRRSRSGERALPAAYVALYPYRPQKLDELELRKGGQCRANCRIQPSDQTLGGERRRRSRSGERALPAAYVALYPYRPQKLDELELRKGGQCRANCRIQPSDQTLGGERRRRSRSGERALPAAYVALYPYRPQKLDELELRKGGQCRANCRIQPSDQTLGGERRRRSRSGERALPAAYVALYPYRPQKLDELELRKGGQCRANCRIQPSDQTLGGERRRRSRSGERALPAAYVALYPYRPQKLDELELRKGGQCRANCRIQPSDQTLGGERRRRSRSGERALPAAYVALYPYRPQKLDELELRKGGQCRANCRIQPSDQTLGGERRRRSRSGERALPAAYVALYPYRPQKLDELELRKGGIYIVTERCRDGWYKGRSERSQRCGVFPGNYVARPKHDKTQPPPPAPDAPPRAPSPAPAQPLSYPWNANVQTQHSTPKSDKSKDKSKAEKSMSTGVSLMKRLAAMKKCKSPPPAGYSMDNPVFEDAAGSSLVLLPAQPAHVRSGSCPSQLLRAPPAERRVRERAPHDLRTHSRVSGEGPWQAQHRKSQSLDVSAARRDRHHAQPAKERFRCIVPYPPNSEYELELRVDDIVVVSKKRGDGWYKGTLQRTGRTGLFPASFVQACPD